MEEKIIKLSAMIILLLSEKRINRTSLNKLLFFSDLVFYYVNNKKISGDGYIKKPYGPVPESVEIARDWLKFNNYIKEEKIDYGLSYEYLYELGNVDIEKVRKEFNEEELQYINSIRNTLSNRLAKDLSELSHKFCPWKSADWYQLISFDNIKSDDSFINWYKEVIEPTLNSLK